MNFTQWKAELEVLEQKAHEYRTLYEEAREKREAFLKETIGFESGDVATVSGTADMISRIFEMKRLEPTVVP